MIQTRLFGVTTDEAVSITVPAILQQMHAANIHNDLWSWEIVAEGRLIVTDDEGLPPDWGYDVKGVVLPNLEMIVATVSMERDLLERISAVVEGTVSVEMGRVEASFQGKRLRAD